MNCNSFNSFRAVDSMTYSLRYLPPPTVSFCFLFRVFRVSFNFFAYFHVNNNNNNSNNNNNKTIKRIVLPKILILSLFIHQHVFCFSERRYFG